MATLDQLLMVLRRALARSVGPTRQREDTYLFSATSTARRSTARWHYETASNGRTVHVDQYGAKEYSEGSYQTDRNGVTVKVDKDGQKLWSEGTFITEKPKQRSK